MVAPARPRFWEIDALRGVAIIMMVIYHLMWDLYTFGIAEIDLFGPFWQGFQRTTASLFLILVGVLLQLRADRLRASGKGAAIWPRQVRRALIVFSAGLLVTAVTYVVLPREYVIFGILHLIGVGMILAYPFVPLGVWNVVPGLALIAAGGVVSQIVVPYPWLLWLGVRPAGFASIDYFPLLPWFGVILLGLAGGRLVYGNGRRLPLPDLAHTPPVRLLAWLSRYALLIYLIHQPLLIAALMALGLIPLNALR